MGPTSCALRSLGVGVSLTPRFVPILRVAGAAAEAKLYHTPRKHTGSRGFARAPQTEDSRDVKYGRDR